MYLTKRNIYILLFAYVFIVILIYSSNNFNGINYFINGIGNFFYGDNNVPNEKNNFKILGFPGNKFIKPYKNLQKDFICFGNSLFLSTKKGSTVKDAAKQAISYTNFYRISRLRSAIMEYNGLKQDTIKNDMLLFIPNSIPPIIPEVKNFKKPDLIYTRGLYFTGTSAGSENFLNMLPKFKDIGINTIVFDVKDVTGEVNYYSNVPTVLKYNTHEKRTIDNIDKLIRALKEQGIYIIARIAVFRDHLLCLKNANFAIKSGRSGRIWNLGSKEIWCDPSNKYVQEYNIDIAVELAEKGVDEIQFDYIRFPTKGDLWDANYAYHYGKMSKESVITLFLQKAYNEISRHNALFSIDIFGVVSWGKEIDIEKTGQRVEALSKYCDVISPMLYPSHFDDDFDGFARPGDEPYHFIQEGTRKTKLLANGKPVRPWLQAFGWRVSASCYNENYIIKQIAGCRDAGANGYLFWNASNSYDLVYRTLNILTAQKKNGNK
jgi:hypothetical protein